MHIDHKNEGVFKHIIVDAVPQQMRLPLIAALDETAHIRGATSAEIHQINAFHMGLWKPRQESLLRLWHRRLLTIVSPRP